MAEVTYRVDMLTKLEGDEISAEALEDALQDLSPEGMEVVDVELINMEEID